MSSTSAESERTAPPARRQESHRPLSAARPYVSPPREAASRKIPHGETSPVLAVLAARGLSAHHIRAAAAGAKAQGLSVGDYLIGNGYVSADTLYRCVAQHLGVPFLSGKLPLRDNIDPYAAARHGFAPIVPQHAGGACAVVAPRGAELERLIDQAHGAKNPRTRFGITTPSRLEDSLRAHAGETIARAASEGLSERDASLSARNGPTREEIAIALMCVAVLLAVALAFPALTGICLALVFFAAILLRLFALAMSFGPRLSGPALTDIELPMYTIIIALYREEAVIDHLLTALERLDYPRAKLDIKIVVEEDDAQTIAALTAVRSRFSFEIIVAPAGAPRTKPRALNVALPFARGALTCVFDAEDAPEKMQLRRAAEIFAVAAPEIACLQAPLIVDNFADNWLTRGIMAQTPPAFCRGVAT